MREGKQNRQKENDWYSVKNKDNLSDMSDNQCIRRRIHDKTKRFEVQKNYIANQSQGPLRNSEES